MEPHLLNIALLICFRVGMLAGDIVVAINGVKVNSAKDVYQAAESSEQITITIQRGDKLIQMQLTPEYSV